MNINAPELLDAGEIDFAIGLFLNPQALACAWLPIEDEYICAMRRVILWHINHLI